MWPHRLLAWTSGSPANSHSLSPQPLLICWEASGNPGLLESVYTQASQDDSSGTVVNSGMDPYRSPGQGAMRSCWRLKGRKEGTSPSGGRGKLGAEATIITQPLRTSLRTEASMMTLVKQGDEMSPSPQGCFESSLTQPGPVSLPLSYHVKL